MPNRDGRDGDRGTVPHRGAFLDQVDRFAMEYPPKPYGYEVLPLSVKHTH